MTDKLRPANKKAEESVEETGLNPTQMAQIAQIVAQAMAANKTESDDKPEGFSIKAVEDFMTKRTGFKRRPLSHFIDPSHRPETFDLKKHAEGLAAKMGHKITSWMRATATRPWMPDLKYNYYAYCDTCGAYCYARWCGPPRDCPDPEHPEVAWVYRAGGVAIMIKESHYLAMKAKRKIPAPHMQSHVT